jgi:acylphosphatase
MPETTTGRKDRLQNPPARSRSRADPGNDIAGNMTTERIIFSGQVQGVGFRYTVRSLARRHPVQGFVRNLPDGTVEVVAQGNSGAINGLLAEVQEHFRSHIRHCERTAATATETFEEFEIRF